MISSSLTFPVTKSKGSDDPLDHDANDDRGGKGGGSDDASSWTSSSTSSSASSSSSDASDDSAWTSASNTSSSSSTDASDDSAWTSASASGSTSSGATDDSSSASSSSASSDDSATSAASSGSTDDGASSATASSSTASSSTSPTGSTDDHGSGGRGSDDATFLFDAAKYLESNPDLLGLVDLGNALDHYLRHGATEDRPPNGWFDDDFYRAGNADLAGFDDATLFMHFNLHGVWEGRAPSALFERFDGDRYLDDNPDVAAYVRGHLDDFLGSTSNGAIAHFLIYGAHEQRDAFDDGGAPIDAAMFG